MKNKYEGKKVRERQKIKVRKENRERKKTIAKNTNEKVWTIGTSCLEGREREREREGHCVGVR